MARYTYINETTALDTVTNEQRDVITAPVWFEYRDQRYPFGALYNGGTILFNPETFPPDLHDSGFDEEEQTRRLVVEYIELEPGQTYVRVLAVQATHDGTEYISCLLSDLT